MQNTIAIAVDVKILKTHEIKAFRLFNILDTHFFTLPEVMLCPLGLEFHFWSGNWPQIQKGLSVYSVQLLMTTSQGPGAVPLALVYIHLFISSIFPRSIYLSLSQDILHLLSWLLNPLVFPI